MMVLVTGFDETKFVEEVPKGFHLVWIALDYGPLKISFFLNESFYSVHYIPT